MIRVLTKITPALSKIMIPRFRDNSVVKDNFVAPKSEIETLQTNTAKLNASNNFPVIIS